MLDDAPPVPSDPSLIPPDSMHLEKDATFEGISEGTK